MSKISKPKIDLSEIYQVTDATATDGRYVLPDGLKDDYGYIVQHLVMKQPSRVYSLQGNSLNNFLQGNSNANTLSGGRGIDTLMGEAGNDIYVIDSASDWIIDTAGVDQVNSSVSISLSAAKFDGVEDVLLTGNSDIDATGDAGGNMLQGNTGRNRLSGMQGNDTLFGWYGNDTLIGGVGNDSVLGGLGADSLAGGVGNDSLVVDNTGDKVFEILGEGVDEVQSSVTFGLMGTNVENLRLTGALPVNASGSELSNVLYGNSVENRIRGGDGNDTVYGGGGIDTVQGEGGSDYLDGSEGADSLAGGKGDDMYFADNSADRVGELLNEGTDVVFSSASFRLSPNVENLTLIGTLNINGQGNSSQNVIRGNRGNNLLSGSAGRDSLFGDLGKDTLSADDGLDFLSGGDGDDDYYLSVPGTVLLEANADPAIGGMDMVVPSFDYTLGANFEKLKLDGTALRGVGNVLNNWMIGNDQDNSLDGALGADTLVGGLGADTLDGGVEPDIIDDSPSTDSLVGGQGNDFYIVNNVGDIIVETDSRDGTDTVYSTAAASQVQGKYSWQTTKVEGYRLGNFVENLILGGSGNLSGFGNELSNLMIGNDGNNTLRGNYDLGAAVNGDDTLLGGKGNDYLSNEKGNCLMDGGAGFDTLIGGAGKDTMDGGDNADSLDGDDGNDFLSGGYGNDTIEGGADKDTVSGGNDDDRISGDLGNDSLCGDAGSDTVLGGSGMDRIWGGDGQDSLVGGTDNDTLYGGAGDDTLGDTNYETGSDQYFGEAGDDILVASSRAVNMSFDGGDGDDLLEKHTSSSADISTLVGGAGADTFEISGWGSSSYVIIQDFTVGEDILSLPASGYGYNAKSLAGTSYQSLVGYEGVFNGNYLIAAINGMGTADAALKAAERHY